jgi:hypothetical protein
MQSGDRRQRAFVVATAAAVTVDSPGTNDGGSRANAHPRSQLTRADGRGTTLTTSTTDTTVYGMNAEWR